MGGGGGLAVGSADSVSGIATDGSTITLTFAKLDPNVLLTFSQFSPLPMKHFEGVDPVTLQQSPYFQKPIGSGPYKITDVKMNNYTTFEPFEDYFAGVAKIEQIIALPSGDGDANVVKNAQAGRLDYGYTKAVADVEALEKMDHMRTVPEDIPYTRMLWINQYPKA
jgi:peptide/nickel transport system substrate-binding protein